MSPILLSSTSDVLDLSADQRRTLVGAGGVSADGTSKDGACFAILDSGVLINVVEAAQERGNPGLCLFKGELANEMRDQAPFLFNLDAEDRFTADVLAHSDAPWHLWGKGGAILFSSHATLEDIHAHWRKFTRVKDVQDKYYYFRFWEPDMLLGFLQACTSEEVNSFFGGDLIRRILLPLDVGNRVVELRLDAPDPSVATRSFPLRPEHFHAFAAVAWTRFLSEMVLYARQDNEAKVSDCDDDSLSARIDDMLRRAHGSYGLTQRGPQKVFVDTALQFGDDFDTALPWAAKVLRSETYSGQMPRARALQKRAAAHLNAQEA